MTVDIGAIRIAGRVRAGEVLGAASAPPRRTHAALAAVSAAFLTTWLMIPAAQPQPASGGSSAQGAGSLKVPASGAQPVSPGVGGASIPSVLPAVPVLPGYSSPAYALPRSDRPAASMIGSGAPLSGGAPAGAMAAVGVTQALRDLKLSVTAPGRIEGLFVKEGDRVRQGDLLLHMDRALEALEVQRREVMLEDTARLEELRVREIMLGEQVVAAQSLLPSGGVSRKQVEDEELAWRAVVAERKALEFAKRRERVELDLAREAHERRHLRSPIDGVVTRILFRHGESVAPHEPVMVVVDVRKVRFTGTVAVADGARIRSGSTVEVELGQEGELVKRSAQVVFVSPVADPASGLVEVIAEFDNPDGAVRPGIAGRILVPPPGAAAAPRGRR